MTKMTIRLLRCLALAACLLLAAVAQAETVKLPSRPDPPRLVNDLAGVLGDTQALEDTLEAFSNATSNQILVVTVTDRSTRASFRPCSCSIVSAMWPRASASKPPNFTGTTTRSAANSGSHLSSVDLTASTI